MKLQQRQRLSNLIITSLRSGVPNPIHKNGALMHGETVCGRYPGAWHLHNLSWSGMVCLNLCTNFRSSCAHIVISPRNYTHGMQIWIACQKKFRPLCNLPSSPHLSAPARPAETVNCGFLQVQKGPSESAPTSTPIDGTCSKIVSCLATKATSWWVLVHSGHAQGDGISPWCFALSLRKCCVLI
jgi:hypothetical protein